MKRFFGLAMLFFASVAADNSIRQQSKNIPDFLMEEVILGSFSNSLSPIAEDPLNLQKFFDGNLTPERDIGFFLFTRTSSSEPMTLRVGDIISLKNSNFQDIPTKIIIHGWTDSGNSLWIEEVRKNYLKTGNYNIIVVDWSPGASKEYLAAVKITKQVGDYVAELLEFLVMEGVLSVDNIHILGHSLGAHIAGFVGNNLFGKISRITGMDPARPDFEAPVLRDDKDRLDSSDAQFVDIIHTCAGTAGFIRPIGHADFYPNGGSFRQPGCPVLSTQFCSHARSHQFMSESIINPSGFPALESDGWKDFKSKKYNYNSTSRIAYMGEGLDKYARGIYFLETNAESPFGRGEM